MRELGSNAGGWWFPKRSGPPTRPQRHLSARMRRGAHSARPRRIRDRQPAVAPERLGGDLDPRRRLAALVLRRGDPPDSHSIHVFGGTPRRTSSTASRSSRRSPSRIAASTSWEVESHDRVLVAPLGGRGALEQTERGSQGGGGPRGSCLLPRAPAGSTQPLKTSLRRAKPRQCRRTRSRSHRELGLVACREPEPANVGHRA